MLWCLFLEAPGFQLGVFRHYMRSSASLLSERLNGVAARIVKITVGRRRRTLVFRPHEYLRRRRLLKTLRGERYARSETGR